MLCTTLRSDFHEITIAVILALLSALSIYTESIGKQGFNILICLVYVAIVLFQPEKNFIYYVALSIPNTHVLSISGISAAVCIACLYVVRKVVTTSTYSFSTNLVFWLVLYCAYMLQYLVRFGSFLYGIIMPLKTTLVLVFLYMYSEESCIKNISPLIVFRIVIYWLVGIGAALLPTIVLTPGLSRLAVLNNDSNMLSIEIAFLFALLSILYTSLRTINFSSYLETSLVCGFLSLACGSRSGLVLFAAVTVITIFANLKSPRKVMAVVILLGITVYFLLNSSVMRRYLDLLILRNTVLSSNGDLTNGRLDTWAQYIDIISHNYSILILGTGTYSFIGFEVMAHNMLLEDIVAYGVIGILILLAVYIIIFSKERTIIIGETKEKVSLYAMMPFFIPVVAGFVLHSLTNFPNTFMLYIGYAVAVMTLREERNDRYHAG